MSFFLKLGYNSSSSRFGPAACLLSLEILVWVARNGARILEAIGFVGENNSQRAGAETALKEAPR